MMCTLRKPVMHAYHLACVMCVCAACTQDHVDTVPVVHTSALCTMSLTSRAWFTAVFRFLQECHAGVYGTVLWSQH